MGDNFEKVYNHLNDEQRAAVDHIYGPVLVIAGPGTGKTQLLSARVANILRTTDANPNNILCLTFTESGAENMRDRLASFIGAAASYEVEISTYHSFGNSLLAQGRDYLDEERVSIDELKQFEIIKNIKQNLPHSNLLAPAKNKVRDILSAIQDIKQENISPKEFKQIANQNLKLINKASDSLQILHELNGIKAIGKGSDKISAATQKIEILSKLASALKTFDEPRVHAKTPTILEQICANFGEQIAKLEADPKQSITHLTAGWKDKYFEKNHNNDFRFKDEFASRKALDLAEIYAAYEQVLAAEGLQDFNDMILRAIDLLEQNADFRFTMQEKYQYILLDEYQDTNGAQSRIVELLTANEMIPDYEPNVLAVGDDDQAIMAFQGAQFSNMHDFVNFYNCPVETINLNKNYRSHQKILDFAENIAEQIEGRLSHKIAGLNKKIIQANPNITDVKIERKSFAHQSTEFYEVADKIRALIGSGVKPREIAILAPKHAILEEISKYLHHFNLPVEYEKSENILDEKPVKQVIEMLKLAQNIAENSPNQSATWAKVLVFDFWQNDSIEVYKTVSKFNRWDDSAPSLTEILLESENQKLQNIAKFFIEISEKLEQETFETILDLVVGNTEANGGFKSPLREFYSQKSDEDFYNLATYLTILREKFKNNNTEEAAINVADFLRMIEVYQESEIKIVSKNAFSTDQNAVQVMTAFSAKGLEFGHTFLISVDDSAWGTSSGNSQVISLPKNMERIKDPNQQDTKKRLFFVAITRAKTNLYLTSSDKTFDGRTKQPLKLLAENRSELLAENIPDGFNQIITDETEAPSLEILEINWNGELNIAKLKNEQLFADKLQHFNHSASSLTNFYDTEYGGPDKFFENYILRFPQEVSGSAQFGTLMHQIFDFWQKKINKGEAVNLETILQEVEAKIKRLKLSPEQKQNELARATGAFTSFYNQRSNIFERKAASEVRISKVLLDQKALIGGNIDRIEIDENAKTIEIVDFKTGNITEKDNFKNKPKMHKYQIQLYFYKILLDHSPEFKKYKITTGRLEFIEGDEKYRSPIVKTIEFDDKTQQRVKDLIFALDSKIKSFAIDTIQPNKTGRGVRVADLIQFEDEILSEQ
ncbi:MAG: ATP-dependent helicase [Candidatus Sacchiramonaceae bacterium]|nr:ATP-dependent helicase [Candidatus Saccharimonadaceae bacterium]